ncbi:MAG: hypothetical protein KGI08_10810 [Thaumarchaeota archaeon]|nr:hypothetical protein [Nitrososphaerota archaeon]
MNLPDFLIRLAIGVLVLILGDRIFALISNPLAKQILEILLLVVVVLYVASTIFIR